MLGLVVMGVQGVFIVVEWNNLFMDGWNRFWGLVWGDRVGGGGGIWGLLILVNLM